MNVIGVVVTPTDKKLNTSERQDDRMVTGQRTDYEEEEDEDDEPAATILESQGTFSNLIIWDHEKIPAADDPFVKGINEWIRFAEAVSLIRSLVSYAVTPSLILKWDRCTRTRAQLNLSE